MFHSVLFQPCKNKVFFARNKLAGSKLKQVAAFI